MPGRILALATAGVAVGAILLPSSPALAYGQCAAGTECGWVYYSDAAHTHLIGEHYTDCQGQITDWGIRQGYSVFYEYSCSGGGGGGDPIP